MRTLVIIGFVLLAVSAPPLVLMGREMTIASAVAQRYAVEQIISAEPGMYGGALAGEIAGHRVELVDDQPFKSREPFKVDDARAPGFVRVVVDGRVHSTPVAATIRLNSRDANRYWGFVYLMKLIDQQGPERLVVAQNLGQGQFRTVSVFPDGQVVEDQFRYEARCSPPVRALLIRSVVPHPSGYCSDVMQVWPSILVPGSVSVGFGRPRPWLPRDRGLVPELRPLVFIGRDRAPGDRSQLYFQDASSYWQAIGLSQRPKQTMQNFIGCIRTRRCLGIRASDGRPASMFTGAPKAAVAGHKWTYPRPAHTLQETADRGHLSPAWRSSRVDRRPVDVSWDWRDVQLR